MLTIDPSATARAPGRDPTGRRAGGLPDELVVLSHLRWVFVWQRPQHLISRVGARRRTWFVEEPLAVEGLVEPRLRTESHGAVQRVWLEVPGPERHVCFSDPAAAMYADRLLDRLGEGDDRAAWLYTPMALPVAEHLVPSLLVYDVMDDLGAFAGANPQVALRQRQALRRADVVFTGGRSLQRSVIARRPHGTYCFPSGVDAAHYAGAIGLRRSHGRFVAGYVGVIDERLDLDLVRALAGELTDWDIRMVGPVAKIDPATLPQAPNLTYAGHADYVDLPAVMAGFDVALMPFALNEATRSISPTKTLEYLAAGLPVVSTRVPDVVADFRDVVDLQDDFAGFAAACRRCAAQNAESRAARAAPLLARHEWDSIADRMEDLIAENVPSSAPA